jgi:hypothetical protein
MLGLGLSLPMAALGRGGLAPSLDLNFMSGALDSRVSFSRASMAWQTDLNGTIVTAPHNLLTNSQEFDNAAWGKVRATVTANVATAPDGTLSADKLIEDTTASNSHLISQSATGTSTNTHTFSVYAKAAERQYILLQLDAGGAAGGTVRVNLADGSTSAITGTGTPTVSVSAADNGWYRIALTAIPAASGTSVRGIVYLSTASSTTFTGDGTSGLLLWGAQLEQHGSARAHLPTTSAAYHGPRFDYDPVTKQPRGLLIEEARTNLHTYSRDINLWANTGGYVTANTTLAPDGTVSADTVTMGADGSLPGHGVVYSAATTHTISCYIRDGAASPWLRVRIATAANSVSGFFNLSTYAVGSLGAGMTGGKVEAVGGGWRRYSFQYTPAAGDEGNRSTTFAGVTADSSGTGAGSYIGWGFQIEAGTFPTSYIPTAGTTVTRTADVATVPVGSWFNAAEGVVLAEADYTGYGNFSRLIQLDDNVTATSNRLMILNSFAGSSRVYAAAYQNTVLQMDTSTATSNATLGVPFKAALAYRQNDAAFAFNGSVTPDATFDVMTGIAMLRLGHAYGPSAQHNGHIRRIRYWPVRRPNADLQALTG